MVGIRPLSVVSRSAAAGHTWCRGSPRKEGAVYHAERPGSQASGVMRHVRATPPATGSRGSQVQDHDDRVLPLVHVVVRPDSDGTEAECPVQLQGSSVAPPHLEGGEGTSP